MILLLSVASAQEPPVTDAPAAHAPAASAPAAEEALEVYLASRLDVIEAKVSTVYAPGYDGSGRFWFVVDQQGVPLDVTDLATRLGDEAVALRIRRSRRASTIGAVALAATGVGLFAGAFVVGEDAALPMLAASPAAVTGTFVLLNRNARRHHPSNAYSREEAQDRVEAYNSGLRDRILGP